MNNSFLKKLLNALLNFFKILFLYIIKIITSFFPDKKNNVPNKTNQTRKETIDNKEKKERTTENDTSSLPDTEATLQNKSLDTNNLNQEKIDYTINTLIKEIYDIEPEKIINRDIAKRISKLKEKIVPKISIEIDKKYIETPEELVRFTEKQIVDYENEYTLFPEIINDNGYIKKDQESKKIKEEIYYAKEPNYNIIKEITITNDYQKSTPNNIKSTNQEIQNNKTTKKDQEIEPIQEIKEPEIINSIASSSILIAEIATSLIEKANKENIDNFKKDENIENLIQTIEEMTQTKLNSHDEQINLDKIKEQIYNNVSEKIYNTSNKRDNTNTSNANPETREEKITKSNQQNQEEQQIKQPEKQEREEKDVNQEKQKQQIKQEQQKEEQTRKEEKKDEEHKKKVNTNQFHNKTNDLYNDIKNEVNKEDFEDKDYEHFENEIDKALYNIELFIINNEQNLSPSQLAELKNEQKKLRNLKENLNLQKEQDIKKEEYHLLEIITTEELQGLKNKLNDLKTEDKNDLKEANLNKYEDIDKVGKENAKITEKKLLKKKFRRTAALTALSIGAALPFIKNKYFYYYSINTMIENNLKSINNLLKRNDNDIPNPDFSSLRTGRDALNQSLDMTVNNIYMLDYLQEETLSRHPELQFDYEYLSYIDSLRNKLNKNYKKLMRKQKLIDTRLFKNKKNIKRLRYRYNPNYFGH